MKYNTNDKIAKYSHSSYEETEIVELYKLNENNIKKYCEWVHNNYQPIVKEWDANINTYWTSKYYIAVKFIFMSKLLFKSYEYAKEKNLKVVIPYLIYYSFLTASRSLIMTSPIYKNDINKKEMTHNCIIATTADIIAKLDKESSKNYIKIIETAKSYRELYSYRFPASGLNLFLDKSSDIISQIKLIKELAILNSQILDVQLSKIKNIDIFKINEIDKVCKFSIKNDSDIFDEQDYYNMRYISKKIKRPYPLTRMFSEGMEEDFASSWHSDDLDNLSDIFVPPEFIF